MRNNSTRLKGKRKLQLYNIKVSSTTVWRYVTNKGWKALREKGRCTLHAGMASELICKLYTKGRLTGKLT